VKITSNAENNHQPVPGTGGGHFAFFKSTKCLKRKLKNIHT
jgi:hypothetical protein